jgi:ankyrin repeat protein
LLIASGAKLDLKDKWQNTALIYAAASGHSEIANSLIAAGASLDV